MQEILRLARAPSTSARSQNNLVAALLHGDGKATLQEPEKSIGIGGSEVASNADRSDRGIRDDNLPRVVAVELSDGVGERSIFEDDVLSSPAQ